MSAWSCRGCGFRTGSGDAAWLHRCGASGLWFRCTCGSGGHPRECELHPEHRAELDAAVAPVQEKWASALRAHVFAHDHKDCRGFGVYVAPDADPGAPCELVRYHADRDSAETCARRIRAALDWRSGDDDPWAAHVAAQDERIARLEAEVVELRAMPRARVTQHKAEPVTIENDAPNMSAERRAWLESEVTTLRRLLAELHPSKQLERLGFESRLSEAEEELKAQERNGSCREMTG